MNDIIQRVESDFPEADVFMTVLRGSRYIFTVIDMEYRNLILAYDSIEFLDDVVKMVNDIIPAVACMARIKTHTQLIAVLYSVVDPGQLFKETTDLRTFSCHGLKCYKTISIRGQYFIQAFDDPGSAGLDSGAYVCSGVKDKCMASAAYCPLDLFGKKLHGERVCFRLYGIPQINDIRCVDDDVADSVFLHIFPGRLDVQFAYIFPPCVLGSACIKHESIGTVRNSFLS